MTSTTSNPSRLFRLWVSTLAVALLGSLLTPALISAQQQNEIALSVDFDGTAGFSAADPLDDGAGAHTPGLDLNDANNVVRTYDQIQYRIDWNVNEVDGTTTTIRMTLPEGVEWLPDPTTPTGVPPGCLDDGTSSITGNDGRDLVCNTDAEHEGSNGAIHPRAFVTGLLDGTPLTVEASIETDQRPPVVSNPITTTVSASPAANWVKGDPIIDDDSGAVIGYEPSEEYLNVLDENGVPGQLLLWNLRLQPAGGLKGSEPLDDSVPIQFFDHFFDATPGARLATPAELLAATGAARVPCGGYDGLDAYPFGVTAGTPSTTPPAATHAGTWTCTDVTGSNSASYPLIQFDISGHDTVNIPTQNANNTANGSTLLSGQVAFWIPQAELLAKPGAGIIVNAITGSDTAIPVGTTSGVDPIDVAGTNGIVPETSTGDDNLNPYQFSDAPTSGTPGGQYFSYVRYANAPFQYVEIDALANGGTYQIYDFAPLADGGTGRQVTNGISEDDNAHRNGWNGDGQTPRGNVLTVFSGVHTRGNVVNGEMLSLPIHNCVAIDTTHQEVIALPPTYTVRQIESADPINFVGNGFANSSVRPITGYTTGTPTSPIGNVLATVEGSPRQFHTTGNARTVRTDVAELDYVLQVAAGTNPGNSVAVNSVTCNEGDADGRGWVDAETGDLSVFQTGTAPDGSALYGDITHFRVVTSGDVPWASADNGGLTPGSTVQFAFQVRVKDDPSVQVADQELFVYGSHARLDFDGTGQPVTDSCGNGNRFGALNANPALGWCNLEFIDDGTGSLDVSDFPDDYDGDAHACVQFNMPCLAHADAVFIVDAQLAIGKVNTAGVSDIVVNGDIVEFEINPRVTGASIDSIANVTVTDVLPANMNFVGFTSQPAGSPCSHAAGTITCNYGTQFGGWGSQGEGRFSFEVEIIDVGANETLTNTAEISGDDPITGAPRNPATSSAQAFTPNPFEESGIEKAVDEHLANCFEAPGTIHDAGDCTVIAVDGGLIFTLDIENEGLVDLENYRVIDVLPFNGDATEPASGPHPFTGVPLTGDGRTPPSAFSGSLDFVGAVPPAGTTVLYTADAPGTISRDPLVADSATTWCNAPAGGTAVAAGLALAAGTGACPATAADVTALHFDLGTIEPGTEEIIEIQLTTVGAVCGDIWTNNFGARTSGILLPIRSNDVSVMAGFCEPSIDIEKATNGLDSDTPDGAQIVAGDPVTWTYVVTNDGDVALANASVTDVPAPPSGISCDVDGDGVFDGTNVIPLIVPGASVTCEATGVASQGPFSNNASVSGEPVLPDFSDPAVDPADPSTWPTDAGSYSPPLDPITGEPVLEDPVDEDPSHYTGVELEPAIDIEKDTNGVQSDTAPGETIPAGDAVTWTYVVENTGTSALLDATVTDVGSDGVPIVVDCDVDGDGVFDGTNIIPLMLPTETVTCQSTGVAGSGPYSNNATVAGNMATSNDACVCDPTDPSTWPTDPTSFTEYADPTTGEPVTVADEDPSHYTGIGFAAAIDIEKDTNGVQSDEAPGEEIAFGDDVTWTYVVTNTGGTALANATVTDRQGVVVSCDVDGDGVFDGTNVIPFLAVGASVTCEGTGTAQVGPYENIADVTGDPLVPDFATCGCDPFDPTTWPADGAGFVPAPGPDGSPLGPVDDADASHYTGTATFDLALEKTIADTQDVSNLAIGDDVTFTIEVFNQGTVSASDISLIDYTPAELEVNDPDWVVDTNGNATIDLAGVTIAPGESTTVDITMTILAAGDIDNTAEITQSAAIDTNGDPILDADGNAIVDIDSVADAIDTDVLSDGVIDNTDGDEDDHDIAFISVAAPVTPETPPVLAFTGLESARVVLAALLALGTGLGLILFTNRTLVRRKED